MREESRSLPDDSPANGEATHGLLTPGQEAPPPPPQSSTASFTAVNGDGHNKTTPPSRSGEAWPSCDTIHVRAYDAHRWRPDTRPSIETQTPSLPQKGSIITGTKRKRADSTTFDGAEGEVSPVDDRASSPKRRVVTLDSAIDLTSPPDRESRPSAFPPLETGPFERSPNGLLPRSDPPTASRHPRLIDHRSSRSPAVMPPQGAPPPQPRPETEDQLAESLEQFKQTEKQRKEEAQRVRSHASAEDQETTTPPTALHQTPTFNNTTSPSPHRDNDEERIRRKRNFSNRTKTGCHTCRERKKKCDEAKPVCENCRRGNFACQGYGPKAPGSGSNRGGQSGRGGVPLQAKAASRVQQNAQQRVYASPPEDGRSYSHWGRVVPPSAPKPETPRAQQRELAGAEPSLPREGWHRQPATWHASEQQLPHDRRPPLDYPPMAYPPPPEHIHIPPPPLQPPPLPSIDPWTHHHHHHHHSSLYRNPSHPSSLHSSGASHSSPSWSAHPLPFPPHPSTTTPTFLSAPPTERDKMLHGAPYQHWLDCTLHRLRDDCRAAYESFNDADRPALRISAEERRRFFSAILHPHERRSAAPAQHPDGAVGGGPQGSIGAHTRVETPFSCEYGFNVHIGAHTGIGAQCYMQDDAPVVIGERVEVGQGTRFLTREPCVEMPRRGTGGSFVAGAIRVEDDVVIGAGVTVLPFRTIGRGAVVGAGSVVTKDVQPYTIVAGNPAQLLRRVHPSAVDDNNPARHRSDEILEQNERMREWMREYAGRGFVLPGT